MAVIPELSVWLNESAAAHSYERRNDFLQLVDKAVEAYHKNGRSPQGVAAIRDALEAYIEDHIKRNGTNDSWKNGPRNRTGAVERLRLAAAKKEVPKVEGPALPPPLPPKPLPRRPADAGVAKLLDNVNNEFRQQLTFMQNTPMSRVVTQHQNTIETRLEALANDLLSLKVDIVNANTRTRSNFIEALTNGFKEFEKLHTQDAEDIEFKLSIAKAAFDALSKLPFPFSVLGEGGKLVAGSFQAQKFSNVRDHLGVKMPEPHGLWATAAEASKKLNDLRTLNVAPAKIRQLPETRAAFEAAFKSYEEAFDENWKRETASVADRDKRRQLAQAMVSGFGRAKIDLQMAAQVSGLTREIGNLGTKVEAEFKGHTNRYHVDLKQAGIWVTVRLIADYALSGLCGLKPSERVASIAGGTLGSKKFGQKFAEFLASPDVGIVELKTGDKKSAEIYGGGKIPWAGHPTHIIGVILYLEYAQRELNPFRLFEVGVTPSTFQDASKTFIKSLGKAMSENKVTHWVGHDTIDNVAALVR